MEKEVGSMEKGSHLWEVKNYSRHRKLTLRKSIESKEFTAGGHRWTMVFYPSADKVDAHNQGYASIYLRLKSRTRFPLQFLYEIYVVNQSGKGDDFGFSLFEEHEGIRCLRQGERCGALPFIKRSVLESPDYLWDDCVRIRCTVGVLTWRVHDLPLVKIPLEQTGFGDMLKPRRGTDVVIRVQNQTFYAHQWRLAHHSPEFDLRFINARRHYDISITDMDPLIFQAMLWFIYSGDLVEELKDSFDAHAPSIYDSFLGKMLAAAHRYRLKSLKRICELRILQSLCLESVAYTLDLADLCRARKLKSACIHFVVENLADLTHLDGYNFLAKNCPSLLSELHRAKHGVPNGWKALFVSIKDHLAASVSRPWKAIGDRQKGE